VPYHEAVARGERAARMASGVLCLAGAVTIAAAVAGGGWMLRQNRSHLG